MEEGDFNDLIDAAKEMVAIKRGEIVPAPERVHRFDIPNVKEIRENLGLSQSVFSSKFGLELRTIQDWESGRRNPTGPAVTLLKVISRSPEAVAKAV
jgi:putative transcriptional regulator